MFNNDVSFILSFVILMEKCGFSGSPLDMLDGTTQFGVLPQVLLGDIRLGDSTTANPVGLTTKDHFHVPPSLKLLKFIIKPQDIS